MNVSRYGQTLEYDLPVRHGGTTIGLGALVMRGATAGTNLGVLIIASGTGTDQVGIIKTALASTVTDTAVTGVTWNTRPIELVVPVRVIQIDYDTADTMAAVSSSGTTITVTSLEDDIDTGWIYAFGGTGAGQLGYIDTAAAGSCTVKTAFATVLDSTSTLLKVLPLFHQLGKVNTAGDKIGTDAAVGTWRISVLQNWIDRNGILEPLNPTKHDGLTGLNTGVTRFMADICIRDSFAYTID